MRTALSMPEEPPIRYVLPDGRQVHPHSDPIWTRPLPGSRESVVSGTDPGPESFPEYGEYFTAARHFIAQNDFRVLTESAARILGRPVSAADIRRIDIRLEKHGAFYHPASIDIRLDHRRLLLVLNVAVSPAGRAVAAREYQNLKRLCRQFAANFIPAVYAQGHATTRSGIGLALFAGQWFDGFHEFHPAIDPAGSAVKLSLWDTDAGARFLTPAQAVDSYRQAATILTYYYNIETFEQIASWHHAAGDFIVKPLDDHRVAMRLITVRSYTPLFEHADHDPAAMVDALTVFLLNLSIKNRIDRIDGTGELFWADPSAVAATLDGFYRGLGIKVRDGSIPGDFPGRFRAYLKGYPETDLHELVESMVNRWGGAPGEKPLIDAALAGHAGVLHRLFRNG